MKRIKYWLLVVVITTLSIKVQAQDDKIAEVNPFRIGLKIGVPNIAGLNFEYVTPLLNNKLAAAVDFTYIPLSLDIYEFTIKQWSLGVNYYFKKPGRGLYAGLATAALNIDATATDGDLTGSTTAKVGYPAIVKFGAKLGKKFYFRTELGYALVNMPEAINIIMKGDGVPDETEEIDLPAVDLPFIFNIGFGVAF